MIYDAVSMATLVETALGHRELAASDVSADEVWRKKIGASCAMRLSESFELCWWPAFMSTQERAFRDAWSNTTSYALDAEVYRMDAAGTDQYYVSLSAANTGNAPESSPSSWKVLTEFDMSIPWRQTGKDWIGTPRAVWTKDPRVFQDAWRCPFSVNEDGVLIASGTHIPAKTVFIEYRIPAPVITYEKYSSTRPYMAGESAYDDTVTRDAYLCIKDNTGDALTVAASWTRQRIPAILSQGVALLAAADEWMAAGNKDKQDVFLARGTREISSQRTRRMHQPDQAPTDVMTA